MALMVIEEYVFSYFNIQWKFIYAEQFVNII